MGKNKDDEQQMALDDLIEQGVIDEVLGVVKSGKEATVYCCAAGDGLLAAKVYRSRQVRGFANDAAYREGRYVTARMARGIARKGRTGRELMFGTWVSDEYATLEMLHRAGADVPRPVMHAGSIIIMEYIGGADDQPAAPLASYRLERDEAQATFDRLMRNVELMLACDRIHGDLSAYNVLYLGDGDLRVIDFPQAIDPRFNQQALGMLQRDLENVCGYFERLGVRADPYRISRELWGRFLRNEL